MTGLGVGNYMQVLHGSRPSTLLSLMNCWVLTVCRCVRTPILRSFYLGCFIHFDTTSPLRTYRHSMNLRRRSMGQKSIRGSFKFDTLPEFAEYVQYVLANSTCRCHLIGLSRLFSQPVDTLRTLNVQPRRNRWEKAIELVFLQDLSIRSIASLWMLSDSFDK